MVSSLKSVDITGKILFVSMSDNIIALCVKILISRSSAVKPETVLL